MGIRSLIATGLLSLLAPTNARALPHPQLADRGVDTERTPAQWQADAHRDIAAVDMWIRSVYPAWVDPKNLPFRNRWTRAVSLAQWQAARVESAAGYQAVMRRLGNAAADPHVDLGGSPRGKMVQWAGIGLERRGMSYFATDIDAKNAASAQPPLHNAKFLGCDGRNPEATLRHHLDRWVTAWEVPGNAAAYASSLFVDQDNPFVARPRQCRFQTTSRRQFTVTLRWQEARREAISLALRPFRRLRPTTDRIVLRYAADGAAWFTIGNFGLEAAHAALREQVQRERPSLLSRPYIVFDLRGNQGGNSALADALIEAVWGSAADQPSIATAAKQWRASTEVIQSSRELRSRLGQWPDVPKAVIAGIDAIIPRLEAAKTAGQPFYIEEATTDAAPKSAVAQPAERPVMPVYVLTDGGCVSSCIVAVNNFRRVGAIQVGDPTQRQTRYVEAWFQHELPSRLGAVVLPIALVPWRESELGGQPVDLPWTGSASDESGLQALIAADAARRQLMLKKGAGK